MYATDAAAGNELSRLKCHTEILDVRDPQSISDFMNNTVDHSRPVDLLLNAAGVMAPYREDTLEDTSRTILQKTFDTNAFGPLLLTQALLPDLLHSDRPRVVIVSPGMESVGHDESGNSIAYHASMAAVHSIGKSMAVDLKSRGVVVTLLHPGCIRSELDSRTHNNPYAIEPEEAAEKLWEILKTKHIRDTGKFWHREGQQLLW